MALYRKTYTFEIYTKKKIRILIETMSNNY